MFKSSSAPSFFKTKTSRNTDQDLGEANRHLMEAQKNVFLHLCEEPDKVPLYFIKLFRCVIAFVESDVNMEYHLYKLPFDDQGFGSPSICFYLKTYTRNCMKN